MDGLVRKMGIGIGWDLDNSGLIKANNQTDGLVDSANDGSNSFRALGAAGSNAGNTIQRAFDFASNSIKKGIGFLTEMRYKLAGVAAGGGAAILGLVNQAGKAEETMSKFQVVFGDYANETLDWAGDFSRSLGQSELDTARWLSGFQDLLVPMGFARGEATELSKEFTQMGVDLGAFTDETISTEDAMRKMQAGITGEREGLKQLGIVLDETEIKNIAYREGLAEQGAELTKQQKAIATYMGIVEQSQDAIGQAQETQDQWARQTEGFRGILKDLSGDMGSMFMPVLSRGLGLVNDFLYSLRENRTLKVAAGFLGIVTAVTGLGASIGFIVKGAAAIKGLIAAASGLLGISAGALLGWLAVIPLIILAVEDLWVGFKGGESTIFKVIDWFLDLLGVGYDMVDLVPYITAGWSRGWTSIKDMVAGALGIIYNLVGLVTGGLVSLLTLDFSFFMKHWNGLIESVQRFTDGFFELFGTSTEEVTNFFNGILDTIIGWWDSIKNWFADNFDFGGLIRSGLEAAINILPGFLQDKARGFLGFDNNAAEDEIEKEAQKTQRQIQNNNRSVNNNVSVGEIKVEAADNPEETGRAVRKELETFLGMEAAEVGV
ncbi:hypothetical protein GM661_00555 [Iocasia frigidifontis]|uniref:Uncharacterized protein n=1 Tax=Iocasia fonsfrigidae TaxID=2682810 RepID=A0A8A7KEG0_9FIRM|nr:hypothetical protein [Iocasia fonsfrigidae]QTL96564.1 hypothetical protein GM661_00555 [Iocasia fonsfrigidae]